MTDRPNIVMIVADGVSTHALGTYGSTISQTPNIDRLAAEGGRVTNCFCTNSICIPSRASILTGKFPQVHGAIAFNACDAKHDLLPALLQAGGYYTAMVGKWSDPQNTRGLDYWATVKYSQYVDPEFNEMDRTFKASGYVTDVITEMSLDSITRRKQDQPFFLMVNHTAIHDPFTCHPKYADMWQDEDIPEPDNLFDDFEGRSQSVLQAQQRIGLSHTAYEKETSGISDPDERKRAQYQIFIKSYLRCLASIDDGVGTILDYLDRTGLSENTLVIFTTDHGLFLGEHGLYDKRFMYEESIRMPCLMRLPCVIEPDTVLDQMVLNVDFAPTILASAGLPVPDDMQGHSFLPLLKQEQVDDWRKSFYYRYYRSHFNTPPHWGVRTERYKLIHYHDSKEWELYDLHNDPHEMVNIYNRPENSEIIQQLEREIDDLREEAGDYEDAIEGNEHAIRVQR